MFRAALISAFVFAVGTTMSQAQGSPTCKFVSFKVALALRAGENFERELGEGCTLKHNSENGRVGFST